MCVLHVHVAMGGGKVHLESCNDFILGFFSNDLFIVPAGLSCYVVCL